MTDTNLRGCPEATHLFSGRVLGANTLSVQGDRAGYACLPRERLADIRDYAAVEVAVSGPGGRVDPRRCPDFDKGLRRLFDHADGLGLYVSQDDLVLVEDHLRALALEGIPLVERAPDDLPGLDDAEILALLRGIDDAVFAGQWGSGAAEVSAVGKLVSAAEGRSLDISEMVHLGYASTPAP